MKPNQNRFAFSSLAVAAALFTAACSPQPDNVAQNRAQGQGPASALEAPGPQAKLENLPLQLSAKTSEQADKTLQERVLRALRSTPGVNGGTISVLVEEGRIHLGGVARSADERVKIERIAAQVPGVTTVSSSIAVEGDTPTS